MKALTPIQQRVLDFIVTFLHDKKYPPTTREISEALGYKSQTSAIGHMRALVKKGAIKREIASARAITIL